MNERYYSILLKNNYKNVTKVRKNLYNAIKFAIYNGATGFILSCEGYFNKMALNMCREFRKIYPFLSIKVVATNLELHFKCEQSKYQKISNYYKDVELLLYVTEPNESQTNQVYKFIINKSLWTISYITHPIQELFKTICIHHHISVIDLETLQQVYYHCRIIKNDEFPHQILKSIVI